MLSAQQAGACRTNFDCEPILPSHQPGKLDYLWISFRGARFGCAPPDLDKSVRRSDNIKIPPQASLPGSVKVSNGDSGSDQEQESLELGTNFTVDVREIELAGELGTNFTVDVREIELTGEQREAISSEIINVILASIDGSPLLESALAPQRAGDADVEVIEASCKYHKFVRAG